MLYDSRIIIEYLDERFPHPPLMPVDPVSRAHFRLALHRIERDWYGIAAQARQDRPRKCGCAAKLRGELRDLIVQTADFVRNKPYFVSDELSLVDVTIAPLLWRLPRYRIELPKESAPLHQVRQPAVLAAGLPHEPVAAGAGDARCLNSRSGPTCCEPCWTGSSTTAGRRT